MPGKTREGRPDRAGFRAASMRPQRNAGENGSLTASRAVATCASMRPQRNAGENREPEQRNARLSELQ